MNSKDAAALVDTPRAMCVIDETGLARFIMHYDCIFAGRDMDGRTCIIVAFAAGDAEANPRMCSYCEKAVHHFG